MDEKLREALPAMRLITADGEMDLSLVSILRHATETGSLAAVAEICETCGGDENGILDHSYTDDSYKTVNEYSPCPDCVDGVRILKGRIIEWCSECDMPAWLPSCFHDESVSVWQLEG